MKKFLHHLVFWMFVAAVAYLASENDRLRDQLRRAKAKAADPVSPNRVAAAASGDVRAVIERQTSDLRQLPFKYSVRYKEMPRAELREYLVSMVRQQYTPEDMRTYERALAAFGLIPENTDLIDAILSMYEEQVAAFYVPDEHALYTFKEQTWSDNIDRMLLSHELTHALQDQNYDLVKFPLKEKHNDDLALASSALIEGDATVLMTRWYIENAGPGKMLSDLASMMRQNTAKLAAAPEYLRAMLLFPYQEGQQFVSALYVDGGARALDIAFRHPPTSTHEILHPDVFLHNRRDPIVVAVPAVATNEWRLIADNVLGEFGVRSVLQQQLGAWQSQLVAQAWAGDRYHIYERATNAPTGLIWVSAWNSEMEAADFVDAYTNAVSKRADAPLIKASHAGTSVAIVQSVDTDFFAVAGNIVAK